MSATETENEWVHYHDGGIPGRRRVLKGKEANPAFMEVPKIDFRRIYSDKLSDREELASEVGAACRDVGFFYAVNHGVDEKMLEDTLDALKKYFALPTEVKMETHNQKTEKFRGYEAFLEGKLDQSTRGDLKEGFLMGEDAHDPEQNLPLPLPSTSPRNQWPTHPSALFFRPAIYRYHTAMSTFSRLLLHIFALALSLPETAFDSITTHPMTNVRAVHYPPQNSDADVGIGAHTDFCWFTLVCQSATTLPALEVLNGNGMWVPVPCVPNSFVVNIADFLKVVTGGSWMSTVHRVRNRSGEERYSMPFFFSPNEDARVSVVEHLRKEGEVYDEFVVGEYFQKRLEVDRRTHLDPDEGGKGTGL
ncbi:Clavaminate synthase-like protein [Dothidotthia symphoricarpi CBS 119687]|uniref:Clavaminate synthase-like protein n=1 Tax=Dothidotthia symphoricarpi CBS 119687 TaxID=1392245 RepID=A0A6A6AQG2_9PLEO|nr:Clavaminate synthase-like protein [Dothidotthia symphoricarpi CBS 119687]KAF2134040.1 Clavaminate synthase-like protein [Dothidotthia symphoricarpi CBS 119687]